MKRTKRQKMVMFVAILLALMMIIPTIISAIGGLSANAISNKDIQNLKDKQKQLKQQKEQIQGELNTLKKDRSKLTEQKAAIDMQIEIIQEEIENVSEIINQTNLAIAQRQIELDQAISDEKVMYELFRVRVRAMEEAGDASYLGILFQSTSFSDLLSRMDFINEIMKSDKDLMSELATKREKIEQDREQLAIDREEQYEMKRELAGSQEELAEKNAEADELIRELLSAISDAEKEYKLSQEEINKINKDIEKAEDQLKKELAAAAAKNNTKYVGGEMLWPVPSTYNISSDYGMRVHPILKVKKLHTGIDIPGSKGSKIVASNSGTVIVASYSSGYGNYLVIDHGGGRTTLYAHQTGFASGIAVGKAVVQGDVIGYVGSTGLSTGPHLHFEVRINGEPTDPKPYLTKK